MLSSRTGKKTGREIWTAVIKQMKKTERYFSWLLHQYMMAIDSVEGEGFSRSGANKSRAARRHDV